VTLPEETDVGGFPIVGMGASAGGLSAFESFFSAMPANEENGTSFVLVQHLAPDHKSILAELVRRYTKMDVFEVEDGMKVRPNCTYIIRRPATRPCCRADCSCWSRGNARRAATHRLFLPVTGARSARARHLRRASTSPRAIGCANSEVRCREEGCDDD
jgi:hypothetical protein